MHFGGATVHPTMCPEHQEMFPPPRTPMRDCASSPVTGVTFRAAIDFPPWLSDPGALASFVERLRAAGVRTFTHPSGLVIAFETGPAARPAAETDPRW